MPEENYTIVAGVVIAIIVLLIAATFIVILVTYSNNRKKKFLQEQHTLKLLFKEQLLQSRLEIQEETFNNISREIHDNVGQVLSLAKVQLNTMEHGGEIINRTLLADIKESIGKAMVDLRDIAKGLSSDRIKNSSLAEMTNNELQRIGRLGATKVFFLVEGKEQDMDEQKKLIVFRIIQESFQNILKHAQSGKIEVCFYYSPHQYSCEIKDDGKGFDPGSIREKDGLGLQNMISRAALIGGKVFINSAFMKGTTVVIHLPYE